MAQTVMALVTQREVAGTVNTGGGSGGGRYGANKYGGSGVVIIRYAI